MEEACDLCNSTRWTRIKFGKFVCDTCQPEFDGFPQVHQTVTLSTGEKLKKSEITEIKRHRMLPYNRSGGGYYAGRMGENGKIQERPLKS